MRGILVALAILLICVSHARSVEDKPNILLLTVDTLRADHLGIYGYPLQVSPNLDDLAMKGVIFDDALTTIGKTGPAFSSLFSSHYPPTTGARRNGLRMRPDIPVLTQLLHDEGYTTAAIISNWTLKDKLCGLARGFDYYEEDFHRARSGPLSSERIAPDVTRTALDWLQTKPKAPIFFWVHYSDPHAPYVHHPEFEETLPRLDKDEQGHKKRSRYASEVRYVDHWIGEFLNKGLPMFPGENTYIVFLSDHGESLGEHDYWGHGKNVFQPNLRIPLFIIGPSIPKARRLAEPASLVDIMPTVLEIAGIEGPPEMTGVSLYNCWNQPLASDRHRFGFADKGVIIKGHAPKKHKDPLAICLVKQGWKAVYHFKQDRWRYFNLTEDSSELHPSYRNPSQFNDSLDKILTRWYNTLPKFDPKDPPELQPEDIEKLKALGYIGH